MKRMHRGLAGNLLAIVRGVVIGSLVLTTAHAQITLTGVSNSSIENGTETTSSQFITDGIGWYEENSVGNDWSEAHYHETDASAPDTPYGNMWGALATPAGGRVYTEVGTLVVNSGSHALAVEALIGDLSSNPFGDFVIEFWATTTGFAPADGTPISGTKLGGVTNSAAHIFGPYVNAGDGFTHTAPLNQVISVDTDSAPAGQTRLWLAFTSTRDWGFVALFDNVSVRESRRELFETFSGASGSNLVGTATPDGNTWLADWNNRFKQDGSFATGTPVEGSLAFLPFTLTQGRVYTLQADIASIPSAEFAALGFSTGVGTSGNYIWDDGAAQYAWMLRRGAAGVNPQIEAHTGPDVNTTDQSKASAAGNTVKIVLDTQNASNYSVTFYEDDVALGSTLSLGSAPTLTHIFIGVYDGSGTAAFSGSFDNLTLTYIRQGTMVSIR